MKAIPFFLLAILISCNETPSSFRRVHGLTGHPSAPLSAPFHHEGPATDAVVVIEEKPVENSNAHELVVEIDQVNSRFTVTGNAGQVCGVNFKVIDRMNYEVLTADQARITLNGRVFDLTRIDDTHGEKIWGDWTTEITEGNYQGNMIFHIRLDPVMKIESDCEAIP
jgi:hypothetical protein